MGVVYRVEHVHLGKTAAMKVLAPETAQNPEMVKRFRLEAQAVSQLNHPNIVQTFDFGQSDGALYLVMEHIKGDDLAALLRKEGPWTFARAARLFAQVSSGLAEAHDAGIIHRDLKPENLMVVRRRDGSEHVKVLDFGLAKLRERADGAGISSGSQVLGTPYYMSPEQVRGETLDARADIYSLGASLYRVLTGEPPFDAPSPVSVLAKHLTDDLIPPRRRAPDRALPPEADRIVLRAMARAAADRYASATDIEQDLLAAAAAPSAVEAFVPEAPETLSAARHEARTIAIESGDFVEEVDRLRRSDVDEFEWSLRRRRLLMRIGLPAIVAGVAAAAALGIWRGGGDRADAVEHEPNNTPGYANLLPRGVPVRGTIGPLLAGAGDVDFFRVPAGKGARVVDARLDGIPNVDLVLVLFDAQGRRLAKSDARGRGWGEWLQPTSIGPGEAYLEVREEWTEGVPPTANAPDAYALTARWGPPQPGWEIEPNDWPAAATAIAAPGRVRGYLGSADDRDWYSISAAGRGELTATVTAPAGVDVVLLRDAEGHERVDRRGRGGGEQITVAVASGQPVLLGVARASPAGRVGKDVNDGKTDKDGKQRAIEGVDDPYELVLELAPE